MSPLCKLKQALAKAVPSSRLTKAPPSGVHYERVCPTGLQVGSLRKEQMLTLKHHKIDPRGSFNVISAIKYREVKG